jgi:peroxiredoxin family protein
LIRDSNKVVATAVIRSARITDGEIETISKSRSISDEIIRIIANNKDWTKNYQVKLNLVNNSKTPMSETLKFINHLRDKELRDLARSRNVSSQVCTAARRLMQKREEASKGKKPAGH